MKLIAAVAAILSATAFFAQAQGGTTWGNALFPWSAAQFAWNAPVQGVWEQVGIEQGDWNISTIPWNNATFSWANIWN